MFENIPNIPVFVGVAMAVVGFLAILMCVSKYLENEKDNAVKKKEAHINNTAYDEVNERLSKTFWFGYLVVAVVGAGISVLLALVVMDFLTAYFALGDDARLLTIYVILSVVVWVLGDRFLFTRLGDSAYFANVESHAIKVFLGDIDAPVGKEPEPEMMAEKISDDLKNRIAGMTNTEKIALLDELLK